MCCKRSFEKVQQTEKRMMKNAANMSFDRKIVTQEGLAHLLFWSEMTEPIFIRLILQVNWKNDFFYLKLPGLMMEATANTKSFKKAQLVNVSFPWTASVLRLSFVFKPRVFFFKFWFSFLNMARYFKWHFKFGSKHPKTFRHFFLSKILRGTTLLLLNHKSLGPAKSYVHKKLSILTLFGKMFF